MRRRFSELAATSPKMNGGKMADRLKFALLSLLVALVTFVAAPIAKADAWDKETIVTFSNPVEVPGQVLPPGTYVFKRAHSEWDRDIADLHERPEKPSCHHHGRSRLPSHPHRKNRDLVRGTSRGNAGSPAQLVLSGRQLRRRICLSKIDDATSSRQFSARELVRASHRNDRASDAPF